MFFHFGFERIQTRGWTRPIAPVLGRWTWRVRNSMHPQLHSESQARLANETKHKREEAAMESVPRESVLFFSLIANRLP